jgi:hypothetical protein
MKKGLFLGFCVLGILILTSSLGFSWGSATHTYIADRIGAFFPLMNPPRRRKRKTPLQTPRKA